MELERLQGSMLDGGRFRLEELLGQGGYGAVFRATQTSMGRTCALKVLHAKFIEADNVIGRFKAEARATSSLRHPNTVVIYDYGHDAPAGLFYIAMEFLEGQSLNELIKARERLDLELTMKLVMQITRSLQDAHDKKIVHRDIKPHNVMVVRQAGEAYFVKVIDFGIAKITHGEHVFEGTREMQLTQTGTMIGTPLYMAPEQIREGGVVDGRTDMYALGMCIYKMLLGHTPYQGMETWEVIGKHMGGPPKPLRYYDPKLPVSDDFERVLLRALRKEKEERYPSILEFGKALQAVCERDRLLRPTPGDTAHDTVLLPAVEATTPMPSRRDDHASPHVPRGSFVQGAYEATEVPVEPRRDQVETAQNARRRFKTSRTEAVPGGVRPHVAGQAGQERTVAGVLTPRAAAAAPQEIARDEPGDTARVAHARREGALIGDALTDTFESGYPFEQALRSRRLFLLLAALAVATLIFLGSMGVAWQIRESSREPVPQEGAVVEEVIVKELVKEDESVKQEDEAGSIDAARAEAFGLATQALTGALTRAAQESLDRGAILAPASARTDRAPSHESGSQEILAEPIDDARPLKEALASEGEGEAGQKEKPVEAIKQAIDFVVIPYGDLYVDGKRIPGKGKRTVKLTEGSHSAYVRKDGRKSGTKRFEVKAGERGVVQFKVFDL